MSDITDPSTSLQTPAMEGPINFQPPQTGLSPSYDPEIGGWHAAFQDIENNGGKTPDAVLASKTDENPQDFRDLSINMNGLAYLTAKPIGDISLDYEQAKQDFVKRQGWDMPKTEAQFRNQLGGYVESIYNKHEAVNELFSSTVMKALEDTDYGNHRGIADFPTDLTSVWQQKHAPLIPDQKERDAYHAQSRSIYLKTLKDVAPIRKEIATSLKVLNDYTTGKASEQDIQNLGAMFKDMPAEQMDKILSYVSVASQREHLDKNQTKGFLQNLGESISRGADFAGDAFSQSDMLAMDRIKKDIDAGKPIYLLGVNGNETKNLKWFNVTGEIKPVLPLEDFKNMAQELNQIATPEQVEVIKGQIENHIKSAKVAAKLKQFAQSSIDPITPLSKEGTWARTFEQAAYDIGSSIAPMAAVALNPAVGFEAYKTMHFNDLLVKNPNKDIQHLNTIAGFEGALEAIGDMLEIRVIKGVMPKLIDNYVKKFGNKAVRAVLRAAEAIGFEYAIETAQDAIPAAVEGAANAMGDDIEQTSTWEDFNVFDSRRFWAMAFMGGVGAGVATFKDLKDPSRQLNRQIMGYNGVHGAKAEYVLASESAEEADARWQEVYNERTAEDIAKGEELLVKDSIKAQQKQKGDTYTAERNAAGEIEWVVSDPSGKEVGRFSDEEAARGLISDRIAAADQSEQNTIQDLLDWWKTQDPTGEAKIEAPRTVQQELDRLKEAGDAAGIANLHERIAFAKEAGDIAEDADLDQVNILGGAKLETTAEGVFRGVISLAKNAKPEDAFEEINHVFVKKALAEGRVTMPQLQLWISQTAQATGQKYANETETDVIENIAKIGFDYAAGRIDESAMPRSFVDYVKRMLTVLKEVMLRAIKLKDAFATGKIDKDFESFLAESVGLDPQIMHDRESDRVAGEIAGDAGATSYAIRVAPTQLTARAPKGIKEIETDSMPLWSIPKSKDSIPKAALETQKGRDAFYARLDDAVAWLMEDPSRLIDPKGYVTYLQKAGIWGEVPIPPTGLTDLITNPDKYIDKLTGGYHGNKTISGTKEAATQGLDSTRELRELIGEGNAPHPWLTALHHMWGVLSRMLPPLHQEGMWLRLIHHRPVLDAIQASIDGKFDMTLAQWEQIVQEARSASSGAEKIGNNATANANSFYLMLNKLNGHWDRASDVYASLNSKEMGRKFWALDRGALGIKNKVQRFIGLTFGIPSVIMDRWKFVEFWLDSLKESQGAKLSSEYFDYGNGSTPEDPVGIYGTYGNIENGHGPYSLALYEGLEAVLNHSIQSHPKLKEFLGDNANASGIHWHGWNAIKNEAVGHTSLDLSKNLIRSFGSDITADKVYSHLYESSYSTEGSENLKTIARLVARNGSFYVERRSNGHDGQLGDNGRTVEAGVFESGAGDTEGKTSYSIRSDGDIRDEIARIAERDGSTIRLAGWSGIKHRGSKKDGGRGNLASVTSDEFSKIAAANKAAHKFGSSVDVYGPEDYKDHVLLLIEKDGHTCTLSISPSGELGSATKSLGGESSMVDTAFDAALATGKVKWLNAFDTVLPQIYAPKGFEAVARLKFDEKYMPEGWDFNAYQRYNNGRPDVVFMRRNPNAPAYKAGDGKYVADYDEASRLAQQAAEDTTSFSIRPDSKASAILKEYEGWESVATTPRGRKYSPIIRDLLRRRESGEDIPFEVIEEAANRHFPAQLIVPPKSIKELPSLSQVKKAIGAKWQDNMPANADAVTIRQDVPSFTDHGIGVVTIKSAAGLAYRPFARITNPAFITNDKASLKIALGGDKGPHIAIKGEWSEDQSMPSDLENWTQVGYNPDRHSFYYDRADMRQVIGGSEAFQIGNTVFVKDAVYGNERTNMSYSIRARDEAYDAAVKAGDEAEMQRLVDEAAKEAGYGIHAYHGTGDKITTFEPSKRSRPPLSGAVFFSDNKSLAGKYAANRGTEVYRQAQEGVQTIKGNIIQFLIANGVDENSAREVFDLKDLDRSLKSTARDLYVSGKLNPLLQELADAEYRLLFFEDAKRRQKNGSLPQEVYDEYRDLNDVNLLPTRDELGFPNNTVQAHIKMQHPLVVDAGGNAWSATILNSNKSLDEILASGGHDGLIVKNVLDSPESSDYGQYYEAVGFVENSNPEALSTVYAVPDPSQIKSADPATYDDAGNLIPLSQRFNPKSNDIRYSIRSQEQIDSVAEAMKNSKMFPEGNLAIYERAKARFASVLEKNRDVLLGMEAAGASALKIRNEKLKQALIELDGVLKTLPYEVRGRVGGMSVLANIGTGDKALADFFKKRVEMLDKELERYLGKEYDEATYKFLQTTLPKKREAGEKPKGIGADIQAIFAVVREAQKWSPEEVRRHLAGIDSALENDELTPEQEAKLTREADLVAAVGDWKNKTSTAKGYALKQLIVTWSRGYQKFLTQKMVEKQERDAGQGEAIANTGKEGLLAERQRENIKQNGSLGILKKSYFNLTNWDQFVSVLFGENSETTKMLVDGERNASNTKQDRTQAKLDEIDDLFTRLAGSRLKGEELRFEMSQKSIAPFQGTPWSGLEFSQLEALSATMLWMQEDGRRHMEGKFDDAGKPISAWRYTQEFVDTLENSLSKEAKEVRAFLLEKYANGYHDINKVYTELNGVSLPQIKNYSPVTVAPINAPKGMSNDPVTGAVVSGMSSSPSALRTRGTSISEPNFRDVLQTYSAHTLQMEHWMAYAPFMKEANGILRNRDVQNAIEAKGGEEARNMINLHLDVLDKGGVRDAAAKIGLNEKLAKLGGRAAQVALVGRISTILLQSTQLGAALAEMPTGAYILRMSKLLSGNLGWGEALKSPYIQRRLKEMPPIVRQAMEGLQSDRPNVLKHTVEKLGSIISGADALFTAGTYAITYDYHLKQAKSMGIPSPEEYARNVAERAVDKLAQPTRLGARSIFENTATGPFARVGWAFASEARKNLALAAYNTMEKPAGTKARTLFSLIILNALAGTLIRNAWKDAKDDDDDELFDEKHWSPKRLALATITDLAQGFPILGDAVKAAAYKVSGEYLPSDNLFSMNNAAGIFSHIPKYMNGSADWEMALKDLDNLVSGMGMLNGNIAAAASLTHLANDMFGLSKNTAKAVK